MQTGLLLVRPICCTLVRTERPPLLNLWLVPSNFLKELLLSACFVIIIYTFSGSLFHFFLYSSINHALQFGELRPFVNVTAVPRSRIFAEKFKNHIMWNGQNRSVIFTMLGSVQGCHIVTPTAIGQYICKAITIVPYGEAWRKFQLLMGDLYGIGQMRGPFDYGCLLTLSSRREGYSSPGMLSFFIIFLSVYLTPKYQITSAYRPLSLLKKIQRLSEALVPPPLRSGTIPSFRIASISTNLVCPFLIE